jgi:adenylylsulfate kinase-like enzyme
VKGLYQRARSGEIQAFTGVSDPYEEPNAPELRIDSQTEAPEESAARLVALVEDRLTPASRRGELSSSQ